MSLRDLVDRKTEIEAGGVSFTVRGLSLEDIVLLLENHKEALIHIFGKSTGADFEQLVRQFPGFVSAAIAYAADEHELEEQVRKLPVGIQLKALQEVWELSSLDVESVGKLAAGVVRGLERLNDNEGMQNLSDSLRTGLNSSPPPQSSSSPMDTDTERSSVTQSGG